MSPTLVPAPPASFGNVSVAGHTITPQFTGTPLPGAAHSSLGKEGKRRGGACPGVLVPCGMGHVAGAQPCACLFFLSDLYLETNLSV